MSRRLAALMIDPQLLLCMTSGKFEVVGDALPADATFVHAYVDAESLTVNVICSSESFEEIGLGSIIPTLRGPIIRRLQE